MSDYASDFIALMESRENWGFKEHEDYLGRARRLSAMILKDVRASGRVPVEVWTLFIAMLPYSDALDALSDLSLVLPNIIKKIITIKTDRDDLDTARIITIERLNQLLRKKLHSSILTEQRRAAIEIALRYADGDYQ